MTESASWVLGPIGMDAEHRVTQAGCRTVLVMVPTVAAGHRLLDLIGLLEGDHRVQVVFTVPATIERWQGPDEFVHAHHGMLLPWSQATQHTFDLVLSASHREISRVRGKLLLVPHGAGNVRSRRYSRKAGGATQPTTGLDRELLTYRGRVIPRMIALPHDSELAVLRRRCPEALPVATVTGDICLDRMLASVPYRQRYRHVLGVGDDQTLVTVSSTWSRDSTFGQQPDLYARLLAELPPHRYRVAAVLHPHVSAVHGQWQVRAWLADCIRSGLLVIPPDEGWQAAMVAADHVLGDHGSTTMYAAALGRPVTLATFPDRAIRPGSLAHHLARIATRLDHAQPIQPQLTSTRPAPDVLTDLLTSRRGVAATLLRAGMYRLLNLPEPRTRPVARPVPAAHALQT
ncbi:MAG TPA: hypothetical protein VEO01_32610 [Pseudonocardiaceae bacterium]|nr:hypothetical protein [Pseudonocardiaceae bacterium]